MVRELTPTWFIGAKAAQTNYYAERQASRHGLPLTHLLTINFALTRIDPRQAVPCFARLRRDRFNKWATRPGRGRGPAFTPTYVFAFENVRDKVPFMTMEPGEPHAVHVHAGLHLPASRAHDFEGKAWEWVDELAGGILDAKAIDLRPYAGVGGYLIKGTTQAWAKLYARGRPSEPQGIIYGRRADTSRNLGPTARRAMDHKLGIRRALPFHHPAAQPGSSPSPPQPTPAH